MKVTLIYYNWWKPYTGAPKMEWDNTAFFKIGEIMLREGFLSIFSALVLTNVTKYSVGRPRPNFYESMTTSLKSFDFLFFVFVCVCDIDMTLINLLKKKTNKHIKSGRGRNKGSFFSFSLRACFTSICRLFSS